MKEIKNIYPIFPLEIFGFPGEEFQLHIFEDRYVQLISDAMKEDHRFLIPFVNRGTNQNFGSFVRITSVEHNKDNDEIDISLCVEDIFELQQVFDERAGKLYKKAQVRFLLFKDKSPGVRLLSLYNEFVGLQGKHQNVIFSESSVNIFELVGNLDLPVHQKYSLISNGNTMAFESNIICYLILQNAIERGTKKVGMKFILN